MVKQAVQHNVRLEINGSPVRLDLSSSMVRSAKTLGAKFAISTDSHHPKSLGFNMPYGVITARRGGLEAGDILNTLPLAELEQELKKK